MSAEAIEEGIIEEDFDIRPYMFEPMPTQKSEKNQSSSSESEEENLAQNHENESNEIRMGNLQW